MSALTMFLRKFYILAALFFLVPFVCAAPPNFKDLSDRTKEIITRLKSDSSKTQAVKILEANANNLTSTNQAKQKNAVGAIRRTLRGIPVNARDEHVEALIEDLQEAQLFLENLPSETLQRRASEYFSGIYPGSKITFSDKPQGAGVQFGKIAHILPDGYPKPIVYYIKTHQNGSTSQGSGSKGSASKSVSPIELFVYKFLQYSGLGPEVHFFWDDEINFYIATKDVGYTKADEAKIYQYDIVKSTPNLLGMNRSDFDPSRENPINPKVIEEFVLIDIISRIFDLRDVLTNNGNFFFIADAFGLISDLKIIDFVVIDTMTRKDLFGEFTKGIEVDSCRPNTPIKRYILTERAPAARIEDARRVLIPMVGNILRAIKYAFEDVVRLSGIRIDTGYLESYRKFVETNVNAFASGLGFTITPEMINTTTIHDRRFHLVDVPHDGNCGVWAIMRALGQLPNPTNEEKMIALRQQAAVAAGENGANDGAIRRIQNPGAWLDTEDFQHFAMALGRPIAIVVQEGVNQTYRHYTATGDITDPHEIENGQAFLNLIGQGPNTIVIYQSPGHYQALLPLPLVLHLRGG
jgi:hypothetical protein